MKNIFKKIAVVALAMIMCVGAAMPAAFAADAKCPGNGNIHTSVNCDYTVIAETEASCEAGGFVTAKCNACAVTFVVNSVEELGHDWETNEVICLTATTKTCKRCGKEEAIPGAAVGHVYGEWFVKSEEGCAVGAKRYRVCSVCGATEEQTMSEPHSWVVAAYEEPVNCTAPGKATYVCENKDCGATKTAILWAKAEDSLHNYKRWDSDDAKVLTKGKKDPNAAKLSCTKDGARTEICIDCGETRVIYTAMSTYQHTLKDMKYHEATLDVNGCKGSFKMPYWECYSCGIMFKDLTADAYAELTKVETFYAKYGTVSPTIKKADYQKLSDEEKAEYYEVYYQYDWKPVSYYQDNEPDVVFVDGTHFKKITATETWWGDGHSGKTTVAATCTTPGYEEINCIKCGLYSFKNTDALGHVFYPDVKDASTQNTLKGALGYSSSASTDKWADLGNVGKALGCGKIWNKVYLPTCTNYASVEWRCLNKVGAQCTETKTTPLTGTRNAPYGHDIEEVEVLPATCTSSGLVDNVCVRPVMSYTITSGTTKIYATEKVEGTSDDLLCGKTERKSVPALGHKFVEDKTAEDYKAVTCKEDGVNVFVCANNCGETKKETVASTGKEHDWIFYSYSTENTVPTCLDGVKGYAVCTLCDMIDPQLVEMDALGHKYVEINDEVTKLLQTKGAKLYVDVVDGKLYNEAATGRVLAAELITVGSCVESAVYKIYCQREGCNLTTVSEPNKDNVKGSHNIVVLTSYYDKNGVYDGDASNSISKNEYDGIVNGLSCTSVTKGFLWYCKDKNCPDYRKENFELTTASKWVDKNGNAATLNRFEFYGTHFNPETGEAITYKDVADERISGAATLAEAQKVKAPVDENGNIIAYAIEIPGTTLVWRYAVDEVSCDNDQVTSGGFYCVECNAYAGTDKAVVGDTRVAHHKVEKGETVSASCLTYGYTPYECENCGYTVQTAFEAKRDSHVIDLSAAPISVIAATCETAGARIYQCADENCRQLVTYVIAPLGHYNVSGDELLTSCFDPNANIQNRRCKNCSEIILSAHNYVDGQCAECGVKKVD